MRDEDAVILECLEDVDQALRKAVQKTQHISSVHVQKLEQIMNELRSERRVFEDISLPARLIVEQLLEAQFRIGQVALEGEYIKQPFTSVKTVKIDTFGLIRVVLGEVELSWRDGNYSYYFYPDKVELRAIDEKSSIKLFFSIPFSRQRLEKFPDMLAAANVVYVHPQLKAWLRGVEV